MIQGSPKFDGMAVLEGKFSFLGATIHLEGRGAFVNTKTGDTHGWTDNKNWSAATIQKLHELRQLMEIDLGRLHLQEGSDAMQVASAPAAGPGPIGLGEHLRSEVPQV